MESVPLFLIAIASVLLLGALGEVLFHRTGVPSSLWLVFCGVVLGPVSGLLSRDQTTAITPYLIPCILVVALVELGSCLQWSAVIRDRSRSLSLAGLSFLSSFLLIVLVSGLAHLSGLLPESWGWPHGLLTAATLGAPCCLAVSRSLSRIQTAPSTLESLQLESRLGSVVTALFFGVFLVAFEPSTQGFGPTSVQLIVSLSLGLGLGLVGAVLFFGFLYVLQAPSFVYLVTVAASLVLYVGATAMGANGILAVVVFAIMLTNAPSVALRFRLPRGIETDKDPLGYGRLIMFWARGAFFLFLGTRLGAAWDLLALGLLIALLLIPARLLACQIALRLGQWQAAERLLVASSVSRGMLAASLALLPLLLGIEGGEAISTVVFTVVVITTATQFAGAHVLGKRSFPGDTLALDLDGEIGASPVSLIAPDKTAQRTLMPSFDDEVPPTTRSAQALGPLPPPVPPPVPPPIPPPRKRS